jgi:hypothetical protein
MFDDEGSSPCCCSCSGSGRCSTASRPTRRCAATSQADVDPPRADPARHRRARLAAPRPAREGQLAPGLHRLRLAAPTGRARGLAALQRQSPRSATAAPRSSTGARALGTRAATRAERRRVVGIASATPAAAPADSPTSTRGSRSSTSARPRSGAVSSSSASASSTSASSNSASATSTSNGRLAPTLRSRTPEAPVQHRGRRRVGRAGTSRSQLGERDVERGAERRDHRDERELAVVGAQSHRDRDRARRLLRRRHGDTQARPRSRMSSSASARSSSSPVTAIWRRRLPRM